MDCIVSGVASPLRLGRMARGLCLPVLQWGFLGRQCGSISGGGTEGIIGGAGRGERLTLDAAHASILLV